MIVNEFLFTPLQSHKEREVYYKYYNEMRKRESEKSEVQEKRSMTQGYKNGDIESSRAAESWQCSTLARHAL